MNLLPKTWNQKKGQFIGLAVTILWMAGCQNHPALSPSSETACSTIARWQTANPSRGWPEKTVSYENVGVPHLSLYMQDYFESHSTCYSPAQIYRKEDLLSATISPILFAGNIIKLPIDMVLSPPWQHQLSRGNYPRQTGMYNVPYDEACPTGPSTSN